MTKADNFLPPFNVQWYRLPEYLKELNSYVTFSDLNTADSILSGGVVWTETNLDFQSSEIIYTIDNVKYIAAPRDLITLETTGAGLDRIDVFYVDTSGELKVRQGQESADPSEPDIIEGEELKVSFVIIRDGQVVPEGVTNEKIYDENLQVGGGEWDTSTPDSSVNLASMVDAQSGSTAIFFNNALFRDEVVFNNDAPIDGATIDTLVFRVKLTQNPRRRNARLFVQVNNTITSTSGPGVVINDGQYGFNASALNAWQTIIVPSSVLGVLGLNPDELIIRNYRRGASFFVDNVLFQAGMPSDLVIPEYTLDIVGDNLNLRKDDDIVSTVDLTTYAEPASGLEEVTEGANTGWRFIGETAGDNVNRYELGNQALDAMLFDGSYVGFPDAPALPYGTSSAQGIQFGVDNKDAADFNSVIIGGLNQTTAYANSVIFGNYNNAGYGYGDVLIGTYNTTAPTNVNSFLFAMGHNVTVTSERFAAGIGLALNINARGQVGVGTSNIPWAGGVGDADRPAFTVGIGTTTTPAARWVPVIQRDGFNVYYDGIVTADYLSIAGIDGEATGKVVLTREWYEAQPGGGDVTAASTFSADNTIIFSDGTGRGVKNSSIVNSTKDVTAAWAGYASSNETYGWNGIAGGDGAWVATSYNGTNRVMWSDDDGQTWTNVPSSDDANQWRHVAYGGGVFIALSTSGTGRCMRSTDGGKTWADVTIPDDGNSWNAVTYGDGVFVAVANSGTNRTMYSTDLGLTWTGVAASNETNGWTEIAYGEGVFVAVASSGTTRTMWSDDYGQSWTGVAAADDSTQWESIAYGDGNFVAVSIDGANRAMISDDLGLTWSLSTTSPATGNVWRDIVYGNGIWIAVANSGTDKVSRSVDGGDTWTAVTPSDDSNTWRSVAYSNGVFISPADSGTNRIMVYNPGGAALRNPDATIEEINGSGTGFEYTTVNWVKKEIENIPKDLPHVDTVANLPSIPNPGDRAFVTDANATTFYSVVAAGGANFVPVFYDGTDWRIG